MIASSTISIEMPVAADRIKLPKGVNDRLRSLLDKQDNGESLSSAEKREAEGLVELAEMLSLMRLRAERAYRKIGK